MKVLRYNLKYAVTSRNYFSRGGIIASFWLFFAASGAFAGDENRLDDLFADLLSAPENVAQRIEQDILIEFARSGSDAMDMLLEQGRAAIDAENLHLALEHFTALVDHAPEFAEGYYARAMAYFHRGLLGAAMQDLAQTLTLEPRHFGAMRATATILQITEQPEKTLQMLYSLRDIHPHYESVNAHISSLELALTGAPL